MFQIHGTVGAPIAIAFDPDGAPFLVKNPNHGNKLGEVIESEVPWREGTRIRSAKRGEFLSMMYRQTLVPDVEIFDCYAYRHWEGTCPYFKVTFTILIICGSPHPIVMPLTRVSWRVGLSPDSEGALPATLNYKEAVMDTAIEDPYLIVSPARAFRVTLRTQQLDLAGEGVLWVQSHFEFGPERLEKNLSFGLRIEPDPG
jgi:hypothetical protein